MNNKTRYERTITEKLEHLPLPDMEDAIWARVKAQLDLDLPTDDGGEGAPEVPTGGGWHWGIGLFVFVASLLTIFLLAKKPDTKPSSIPATTLQNTAPSTTVEQRNDTQQQEQAGAGNPAPVLSPGASPPPPFPFANDSIAAVPALAWPLPDTLQQTVTLPPPTAIRLDTIPKKKTRGVSGITDDDYRIVPAKKDSL